MVNRVNRVARVAVVAMVAVLASEEVGWAAPVPTAPRSSRQGATADAPKAEAYYFFLLGRHLEKSGDIEGAADAYERAAELDAESADILSELGAMRRRHNQPDAAIAAAERALQRDADSEEANRILGMVYARLVGDQRVTTRLPRDPQTMARYAKNAIGHLEKARASASSDVTLLLVLGRLYVRTRAHENAIEVLTKLLDEEPRSSQALQLLARAYDEAGRRADAIALLEAATQRETRPSRILGELAELYEQDLRWTDAVDAYEKAIEGRPRSGSIKRRLASALLNAGETTRARDVLRELVEVRPTDAAGLYLLSDVERRLNNFEAAEATARRLMAVEPDGIRGAFALAQVFEQRREYRAVVETLEPAVAAARDGNMRPRQISSLLARVGFAYQEVGEFDQAIAMLKEALELSPAALAFEVQLGQAYVVARRFSEALESVRRAQGRHADSLNLSRLEAQALSGSGQLEQAVSVLKNAVDTHQGVPIAYVALADLYEDAGEFDAAHGVLETAGAKFPEDTSILFQLGAVFERQKQYRDAERVFRQVLSHDPQHASALNYLGYMLADRGERLEESVDLLRRAIAVDPHNPAFLDSLGWAYFKLNRLDLAEAHLQEASDQLTSNSVVQDHLGDLMYTLGRYREAIVAWERALSGNGEEIEPATIERKIRDATEQADRE